jgi:hypothetical protein
MPSAGFTPTMLYLLGGLIVWGVRFLFVYIFTALSCARGLSDATVSGFGMVQTAIVLSTLLGVGICAALIANAGMQLRHNRTEPADSTVRFVHVVAALVAGGSIIAMVWETAPVLFIPVCRA